MYEGQFDRLNIKRRNPRIAMSSQQHLVRGSAKAFVPRTLTMFNRSREGDLTRETIYYEFTYRDFDDAGTFVVTSGSSHARSGTPVALHCAHIFKGGEAPAGISMVGILFLLALRCGLPVFCNSDFPFRVNPTESSRCLRFQRPRFIRSGYDPPDTRHLVYRCTGSILNPDYVRQSFHKQSWAR
jgi:hypothetical protein